MSSRAAVLGSPEEYVDYAASKAALDAMTIGLSKEVAAEGIRVNGVRPGLIRTDMHASGGEPGRVDRLGRSVPQQRGGEAVEVARAIAWLMSESPLTPRVALSTYPGGVRNIRPPLAWRWRAAVPLHNP